MSFSVKTEAAFRFIKRDLMNGSFLPGEPLRLPTLGQRYGLSATPLREALSRLVEQGHVTSTKNCGWRAAPVSVAEVESLEHARLAIESQLLADVIAAPPPDWDASVGRTHDRLARAAPPTGAATIAQRQRWIAAHEAFHAALLGGAQAGSWLWRLRTQLTDQLQRHHQAILFAPDSFTADRAAETCGLLSAGLSVERHAALMEAVLSRDPDAAQTALQDHVATTLRAYHSLKSLPVQRGEQTA